MTKITIEIPDNLNISEQEVKMIIACRLFDKGELTSGQAAQIAGISKWDFVLNMGKYGASLFHLNADDLENEVANARP